MKQRVITSIILLAIVIPVLIIGGPVYQGLIYLIGILGMRELLNLYKKEKKLPKIVEYLAYFIIIVLASEYRTLVNSRIDFRVLITVILAYLLPVLAYEEYDVKDAFYLTGFSLFFGLGLNMLINIRNLSVIYIIYILLLTNITDSFALFTGMLIGKHKLNERISPNKTVEGFIGGSFIGTLVASTFYWNVIANNDSLLLVILISFILTIMGQFGDLFFSAIKRRFKVKDFSNIFKGHGGMLDRMDSLLFITLTLSLFLGVI